MEELLRVDDRGLSPEEVETWWNASVDRLYTLGLRPAEEPCRSEQYPDGFVAWYRLERA